MSDPEPWRKTGRKAGDDHWIGLGALALLEVSVYDDLGRQQGRGLVQLTERGTEVQPGEGQTWLGKFVSVEDEYYQWWLENTYGQRPIPVHFCQRQAHRCTDETVYRNPIHVDVFRVLPGNSYEKLGWLNDKKKEDAERLMDLSFVSGGGGGIAGPGPARPGTPPPGAGEEVQTGEAGIDGLAAALGANQAEEAAHKKQVATTAKPAKPKDERTREGALKTRGGDLQEVIAQRTAPQPADSALKMKGAKSSKKKRKRDKRARERSHKKARSRGREKDDDSSEDTTTSTSSSESLFRLAALPEGTERLHRLHQERPGMLANLTLRRFHELLQRSTGGGAAERDQEMPAVARAYLNQIYLPRHPEGSIGLRNMRELRTLTTLVDMVALNDPLRALDVALQRIKSIELFVSQGHWNQANLLELVVPEEEQRAWFRQELKAAQQEQKADLRLQQDQWPRRRQPWSGGVAAAGGGEKKEGEGKDDAPPSNGSNPGKGKKGKGKGKKGRGKW